MAHPTAEATLDPVTLDVTAVLRHVADVEEALPPPRRSSAGNGNRHFDASGGGGCTASPDVQLLQLPRHIGDGAGGGGVARVDLFLVSARTARVVGAGVVAVPVSCGGGGGRGTLADPVTICCAYCEDDEVAAGDGSPADDPEDETITCLALLALDSRGGGDTAAEDHRVAVVLGTSLGRVLSTELLVHHERGIRRTDASEGGDPFEPLPVDYDEPFYIDGGGAVREEEVPGEGEDRKTFLPDGGVRSLGIHTERSTPSSGSTATPPLPPSTTSIWVTYGDGSCVRVPDYAMFESVVSSIRQDPSSARIPLKRSKVDARARDDPSWADCGGDIIFLPKSHPSLLMPIASGNLPLHYPWMSRPESLPPMSDRESAEQSEGSEVNVRSSSVGQGDEHDYEFCEAVALGGHSNDALEFHCSPEGPPSSHASKESFETSSDAGGLGGITGAVLGGTKAVFGAAVGAFAWGLGGGGSSHRKEGGGEPLELDPVRRDTGTNGDFAGGRDSLAKNSNPFAQLYDPFNHMAAGVSLMDPPRKLISFTVNPDGDLAASTDTLGRILLFDLETKQVVRIWKGMRDASCCWIQTPRPQHLARWGKKYQNHLAIHSRERCTLEIWRVRHGPRLSVTSVSTDACLRPCQGPSTEGSLARCFLLEPATLGDNANLMQAVTLNNFDLSRPKKLTDTSAKAQSLPEPGNKTQSTFNGGTMQLQLMKQLLASETNVTSSQEHIFNTFTQIGSIADLSCALDLLATAENLEEQMGVQGSSFHSRVLKYCDYRLNEVSKNYSHNSHLKMLRNKILHHQQLVSAYDDLHQFEIKAEKNWNETEEDGVSSRVCWGAEAEAWVETYEAASSRSIDEGINVSLKPTSPLKFAAFAKSFQNSQQDYGGEKSIPIYLCDSRRDRSEVLGRIFRPLTMDLFVYKTVNSIFESLGTKSDYDNLQQYFGEWFMSLPIAAGIRNGLYGVPFGAMARWLVEMTSNILDESNQGDSPRKGGSMLLCQLHRFCAMSPDLPRAFLLAAICREAVFVATQKKEASTYGKVTSVDKVVPWDQLLRKIRVCLFITLRLAGAPLGSFPVTVLNIDAGDIFSIHQWIARDELFISHKHFEIVSLEDSCRASDQSYDPSSAEGDLPQRWSQLQKACLAAKKGQGNLPSRFIADSEQPLLFYLKGFNDPVELASHRALLLGELWGKEPQSIDIIKDSLAALRSLGKNDRQHRATAFSVQIELWQNHIRPIFRALLFGFHDVPELSEDIVAPLCNDFDWVQELGRVSLDLLSLIAATASATMDGSVMQEETAARTACDNVFSHKDDDVPETEKGSGDTWPSRRGDILLRGLIDRARPISFSSLEAHRAIVCAAKLTDDLSSLSYCIPSFEDAFLQQSLFIDVPAADACSDYQEDFLNDIVTKKAMLAEGLIVDHFVLEEIESLGNAWGFDRKRLRSHFLLIMYDLGKDSMVNELANLSDSLLDFPLFIAGGLEIACTRLNATIRELKKSKICRGIVGMLDADVLRLVKRISDQAVTNKLMQGGQDDMDEDDDDIPPLSSTHALVLRVLRMSSGGRDPTASENAHSVSILTGTLLSAVHENDDIRSCGFTWAL